MSNSLLAYEAELNVLGTLIREPNKFFDLRSIKAFMFSAEPHQLLFDTISELNSKSLVANLNLIVSHLQQTGILEKVGGEKYLQELEFRVVPEANINEYCSQIVIAHKRRALSILGTKISGSVSTENPEDICARAKNDLDNIAMESSGNTTQPINDFLVETVKQLDERLKNPGVIGLQTGLESFDMMKGGLRGGELIFYCSRPSQGKTAILCNETLNIAKTGNGVLFIEREMTGVALSERFIAIDAGISLIDLKTGRVDKHELDRISTSVSKIKSLPIYVDISYTSNFSYIASTIKRYKQTRGIKIVCLDYIQLLSEREENQTQELGRISRELKLLALDLNITIVVASQLNRLLELRPNKRPILSDMRQSGNLEEDADLVIGLYRPCIYEDKMKNSDLLEHIILKHRDGPIGTVMLKFNTTTNRIEG